MLFKILFEGMKTEFFFEMMSMIHVDLLPGFVNENRGSLASQNSIVWLRCFTLFSENGNHFIYRRSVV